MESAQVAPNSEVVALYELVLSENSASDVKPGSNLFAASISYRKPDSESERQTESLAAEMPTEELLEQVNKNPDFRFTFTSITPPEPHPDFRFAAAVALFAQILQKSEYCGNGNIDTVLQLLQDSVGDDPQRKEFAELTSRIKEELSQLNGVVKSKNLPSDGKP